MRLHYTTKQSHPCCDRFTLIHKILLLLDWLSSLLLSFIIQAFQSSFDISHHGGTHSYPSSCQLWGCTLHATRKLFQGWAVASGRHPVHWRLDQSLLCKATGWRWRLGSPLPWLCHRCHRSSAFSHFGFSNEIQSLLSVQQGIRYCSTKSQSFDSKTGRAPFLGRNKVTAFVVRLLVQPGSVLPSTKSLQASFLPTRRSSASRSTEQVSHGTRLCFRTVFRYFPNIPGL